MHPTLPLTKASIRDLCESLDYLLTEGWLTDKVYLHNIFKTHTYNNESLILVDTSVPREVRLDDTVNVKKSVVIKDITGNAGVCPILISLIGPSFQYASGLTPGQLPLLVTLQGLTTRQFKMYVPWGSVQFSANDTGWTMTVPRSTCISMRGFRLPQNLNLALPPAIGASRQSFDSLVYFPAVMAGSDIVPPTYNGFSASVCTVSQIALGDPLTSSLTAIFQVPDPPTTTGKEFSDLSIVNDLTLRVPGDCADLNAALRFLSNKTIMPDVGVTIQLPYQSAITNLLLLNHPQAAQITIQGIDPYHFSPAMTHIFSSSPGAVLMDITTSLEDRGAFNVGDIILIDSTTPTFRRWNGAWPVVSTTATTFRILISDWGANYPTQSLLPAQSRWRQMKSIVTVTGPGNLSVYSDGATINNVAFVGQSNAVSPLSVFGKLYLNVVAISGFTGNGLYGGWGAILDVNDLFSCSNGSGLHLTREALLNAETNPSSTGLYLNGNTNGFSALNGKGRINPLFAVGNANTGLFLDKASVLEILNSYLQNNFSGLSATTASTATGNTNTITDNGQIDIIVSDGALVKMSTTSAVNLSSPNKVLNADGSRIDLF